MKLEHGIHLGYCTNIHRGESWEETFAGLRDYTMRVRDQVCPDGEDYGIGLRLSERAARELAAGDALGRFRDWLAEERSYVFTINGFPYGAFHGERVKEQVYAPDWTSVDRLEYTNLLFDLLGELLPEGMSGSVSTLPGSFKEFNVGEEGVLRIMDQLKACSDHIERVQDRTGKELHLGLEPEPLGLFETSGETIKFFGLMVDRFGKESGGLLERVGVNYDTCHLALEFEEPEEALGRMRDAGIRISKIHLSSALKLKPTAEALERLKDFGDDVYLHQVIVGSGEDAPLRRYRDLEPALAMAEASPHAVGDEWRVHFHVPLHAQPELVFEDTRDHLVGAVKMLGESPEMCQHLEMETYTWEVLPEAIRAGDVVEQLGREYEWCLGVLRGFKI